MTSLHDSPPLPGAFFTSADNQWFQPTDHTRGPWDESACHAGPPTGLLARAVEGLLPDQRLTRLTVNLLRPIPFSGFLIESRVLRRGRTVSCTEASLMDKQGKVIVNAQGMHLTPGANQDFATQHVSIGTPDQATAGKFPIQKTLHTKPAFNGTGVSVRYPSGQDEKPGSTIAWLRTVPLLADETPSAFQRICPLADCGNAFGRNAEPNEVSFMNTDLTLLLHRDPQGDWLGTNSAGYWESNGIGMADAQLFDAQGAVGRALQTLVIRKSD
ncbi:MAG: thioesterase family protein [Granulosicoccus sp.]|nr:thioesterase family protein [Granulosicoccus sp.]